MNLSADLIVQIIFYIVLVTAAISKLATKEELKDKVKERDVKIQTVYEKIDLHKSDCRNDFVRKDVAEKVEQFHKDEVRKLDDDAKTFRHEILNVVQKISLTLEDHKDKFAELKELIIKNTKQ